jgi:hypothetical protein
MKFLALEMKHRDLISAPQQSLKAVRVDVNESTSFHAHVKLPFNYTKLFLKTRVKFIILSCK